MQFRLNDIRSKLGRKFIVLLFLVALLPMLLFASFSYNYLGNYLYRQSQQRLANETLGYSTSLYERLLLSSALFEALARGDTAGTDIDEGKRMFSSTATVPWQRWQDLSAHWPAGMRAQAQQRLEAGKLVLAARPDGSLYFLQLQKRDPQQPLFLAQLDAGYLLGARATLDPDLTYCVFASFQEPLLCTQRNFLSAPEFTRLRNRHPDDGFSLEWDWGGQIQLAQVRPLLVTARFGVPNWHVWVSEPRRHVFEALGELQRMFSLVVAVALLLATVLAVWQIRRYLTPLMKIHEGTRAVARRDFDVAIAVDSGDELQELAESFNDMAHQLDKQFAMLTGLSRIDQLILNVPDPEQVAQTTLQALQRLVSSDVMAVALCEADTSQTLAVFGYQRARNHHLLHRHELSAVEAEWFHRLGPVHRAGLNDAPYLGWLWPEHREMLGGSAYLFPIVVNQRNQGLMAVAWEKSVRLPDADRELLKDFADRLAVAIAAVLREKTLYQQAHFDALTRLPNRQLLKDRLEQALRHALKKRVQGAVLFVDLDKFKQVNDAGGHSLGDEILQRTAERLRICVSDEDTVARQGGDEFIVVLHEIDSPLRATRVAEKIHTMLTSPFRIGERKFFLGASVGIAIFPNDGADTETLLRNADTALYRVKEEGRGHYRFFEEEMNLASQRRVMTERRIRDALEMGNIVLHYQPQWYLNRDQFSVEALVRIRDPEAGLLAPLEFIGVAEDTGLILDVGEWVLRQACQQMASWRMADLKLERMAINVSAHQLARSDFVKMVESAVDDFKLDFTDLELEITESTLIHDAESAAQKLGLLSRMGVRIAIDDFGTGYSSLSYLHRLPFDVVKIDRSFVSAMHDQQRSLEITATIVNLAKSLNKIVMAEGVETREQLETLRRLQCDAIQGFYISRPLTAAKAEEFIAQYRPVNLPALARE